MTTTRLSVLPHVTTSFVIIMMQLILKKKKKKKRNTNDVGSAKNCFVKDYSTKTD